MKNYLAVDTSGNFLTVLAVKEGVAHAVHLPDCAMKHSVSVMPAVEEALQKVDMRLEECDFFAAVVGAGSFTGIRIGISVVKGFCLACNLPSLPITSFDVAAYNGLDGAEEGVIDGQGEANGKVLCLVDALHDCYYACGYEHGEVVYPPAYLSEEEVLALTKEGYALRALSKLPLSERAEVALVDPVSGLQKAVEAALKKGGFGELSALYVRKSSAELNLGK